MSRPVLLIGCGRMGGAMAGAWASHRQVMVYDPAAIPPPGAVRLERLDSAAIADDPVVVLAVKPQSFAGIAPLLAPLAAKGALIVSIMAGQTLSQLADALGGTARLVRAMPNLPAAIGRGTTVAVAADGVKAADRRLVSTLFSALGSFHWIDREDWMDAVTAVSGSGPAYFFRFAEALARAGETVGLPSDLAMRLALETFIGAGLLAGRDEIPIAALRKQITSPGGTTAAGLARMDEHQTIDRLMQDIVEAAILRSRELQG